METLGKPAPVYAYEDVCADPAGFVAEMCGLLDLPAPIDFNPEVELEILRDDVSAAWIERFRKEYPDIR